MSAKGSRPAIYVLVLKFGGKLLNILPALLKVGKAGKLALAGASIATYTIMFSWQFALALVTIIVVHECGHLLAMKCFGMKTRGIYLIPFVGGAAVAESRFPNKRTAMIVALAGPAVGSMLIVPSIATFMLTHNVLWAAVADWTALINLFNLIPVLPLDGGKALEAIACSISKRSGLVPVITTILLGAALTMWSGYIFLGIIIIIGCIEVMTVHGQAAKHPHSTRITAMSPTALSVGFIGYATLAAILSIVLIFMAREPGVGDAMKAIMHW